MPCASRTTSVAAEPPELTDTMFPLRESSNRPTEPSRNTYASPGSREGTSSAGRDGTVVVEVVVVVVVGAETDRTAVVVGVAADCLGAVVGPVTVTSADGVVVAENAVSVVVVVTVDVGATVVVAGALGVALTAVEGAPPPTVDFALTRTEYVVPFVSDPMRKGDEMPPIDTHAAPFNEYS